MAPSRAYSVASVDELSDAYISDFADLDPCLATILGVTGHDGQLTDYSPDGFAARDGLNRRTRAALVALPVSCRDERVAARVLRDHLDREIEAYDAGVTAGRLCSAEGPLRDLQRSVELLDRGPDTRWDDVLARLQAMPDALDGLERSLVKARRAGQVAARRQVLACAGQCGRAVGYLSGLANAYRDGPLRTSLDRAAALAGAAFTAFAGFLRGELAPHAPATDAVGRERYQLSCRYFLGTTLDLDQTCAWGWDELARIEAEMRAPAGRVAPGEPLQAVMEKLDTDPAYSIAGAGKFRGWLQELADRAITALDGAHFDIPVPLRRIECRIPPTAAGGIYYLPPSEDFRRPGRVYWTITGEPIPTWTVPSTMYHEGVPGHHLQQGMTVSNAGRLNRFRRAASEWGNSGHGEGWALYAERLMGELGHYPNQVHHLGMLAQQQFRAARVVLDIGLHLGLEIPPGTGFGDGERWTPASGAKFLRERLGIADKHVIRYEIDRYLGRPGQAASYKVGERVWLELRDQARRRHGNAFDLKSFHRAALDLGPMGLDAFREAMADALSTRVICGSQ